MRLSDLSTMEKLFFPASKRVNGSNFRVVGEPYQKGAEQFYTAQNKDFSFVTYKEVVVASLLWTKELFGSLSLSEVHVKDLEIGDAKEWFNTQLIQTNKGIKISGEEYYPFVNIQYSYNKPSEVVFDIGFYRYACSNGVLWGSRSLKVEIIDTKDLYQLPLWINPCFFKALVDRFEIQFRVFKSTELDYLQMRIFLLRILRRWNVTDSLIDNYVNEMGVNVFTLINILTDAASKNYDLDERIGSKWADQLDGKSNRRDSLLGPFNGYFSTQARRQKAVGAFLEKLFDEIMKNFNDDYFSSLINSDDFKLTDKSLNQIGLSKPNIRNNNFNLDSVRIFERILY
jgi:hypothetical protein